QVITTTTVKDRYLFLFTDVLVIAKLLREDLSNPEESTFQIKNILALRSAQLVLKDERWQYTPRAPSPAVQAAVRKFATNPIKAVAYLISKRAFPCTTDAIAHFLHVTPGLSRRQLGRFLGVQEHHDILQAFLDMLHFKNLRVDESLRLFLSTVRLPGETFVIDAVLDAFAKRWYNCNKDSVHSDANVILKLVFAIMELNADLHNPYADEGGKVTMREFVDRFRTGVRADAVAAGSGVLYSSGISSEVLGAIYDSVRKEKLEMAEVDWDLADDDTTSLTLPPFPSRLTLKHTSAPILVRIPFPDPHLRIHLYGQDLQFSPQILTFAEQPTASFTIRGTGLGRKLVFFSKRGSAARRYQTPFTRQITIEPAFLRHSFQLSFWPQS
ncbi:Sec7 domain-containing protein, partial [Geranomyces variabilis]